MTKANTSQEQQNHQSSLNRRSDELQRNQWGGTEASSGTNDQNENIMPTFYTENMTTEDIENVNIFEFEGQTQSQNMNFNDEMIDYNDYDFNYNDSNLFGGETDPSYIPATTLEDGKLISDPLPIETLKTIFNPDNETTQQAIDECLSKYSTTKHMRRVVGDGNCFIRAFTYGLIKHFLMRNEKSKLISRLKEIHKQIEKKEGDISHIDVFYEEFLDSLDAVHDMESLLALVNRTSSMDAIIWWQRMIASFHIQTHEDTFFPFIQAEGYSDVKTYCEKQILPVNQESENLFIIGICEAFRVRVEVLYLDSKQTYSVLIPDNESYPIVAQLLFRPGHYDLAEE